MQESCYLCGTTENLTRDHVPPRNLFPEPKPTNLITVPCCGRCNSKYSKDDEVFRLWVSTGGRCSPAGKWIWTNKVAPSLETRNKKLASRLHTYLGVAKFATEVGEIDVRTFGIPVSRAEPYIVRVTKGLLHHYDPDYDYKSVPFRVAYLKPDQKGLLLVSSLTSRLVYDQRGEGVFRFWRGQAVDAPESRVWVYLFYDAAYFIVFHGRIPTGLTGQK